VQSRIVVEDACRKGQKAGAAEIVGNLAREWAGATVQVTALDTATQLGRSHRAQWAQGIDIRYSASLHDARNGGMPETSKLCITQWLT
jgi:hypothetical protein